MAITFEEHMIGKNPNTEGLINPFIETRTDICPKCKAQRVELFSYKGYPQNYKEAVELHLRGHIVEYNKYEIRSMKCRSCNHEFVIDWSDGFPKPLRSTMKTDQFFREFANGI